MCGFIESFDFMLTEQMSGKESFFLFGCKKNKKYESNSKSSISANDIISETKIYLVIYNKDLFTLPT